MKQTRGFITIATGKEEYYILAKNLLHSYRYFCDNPLPFAILCDRENQFTADFDDVLIFKDGANSSYLDKLALGAYLPYDETIFIDADCLAFGDLNAIFEYFREADDFSCFGRVLPLDDKTGWFEYENLGELKTEVSYVVGLHGGIYYMRKGEVVNSVFERAKSFIPDYPKFKFKGKFDTPGDEPLVALSMAVNECHPVPFLRKAICCYWEFVDSMNIDISAGKAEIVQEPKANTILVHWGTRYTRELEYKKQLELLDIIEEDDPIDDERVERCKKRYARLMAAEKRKQLFNRVKNKIKRTMGI